MKYIVIHRNKTTKRLGHVKTMLFDLAEFDTLQEAQHFAQDHAAVAKQKSGVEFDYQILEVSI